MAPKRHSLNPDETWRSTINVMQVFAGQVPEKDSTWSALRFMSL
jgi:hypothetical protein